MRIVGVSLLEPPTRKALALLILSLLEMSASLYWSRRQFLFFSKAGSGSAAQRSPAESIRDRLAQVALERRAHRADACNFFAEEPLYLFTQSGNV